MSEDQFTKLFTHFNRRFDELDTNLRAEIQSVRNQVEVLHGAVDTLAGDVQNAIADNLARDAQLARHHSAIQQLADQAGVRLQYE